MSNLCFTGGIKYPWRNISYHFELLKSLNIRNYTQKAVAGMFSHSKVGDFIQEQPHHQNAFLSDRFLVRVLERMMPVGVYNAVKDDLIQFGNRVSSDIWNLGQECAANEPYLHKTSAWGRRVDELVTCQAWKQQKRISAEEGLVAIAYHREFGEFSRLYQVCKLYMYSPASGLFSCPLAMTDGAARTFESNGLLPAYQDIFSHLTTRDPEQFWTSGQWMTERRGGSDVATGTDTVAMKESGGGHGYRLYGYKWFSSATDSDVALTLARIADGDGRVVPGTKGVSMFLLKTRDESGQLNGIEVVKLKNKLGTRQLPTGELLLDGASAEIVSPVGRGIAGISSMLTITRLHNIISSVAGPRKLLSLARDYATRREAFGQSIYAHTLHLQTMARMETEVRGCTILMLDLAHKTGLEECGLISDEDALIFRLMMPVAKMYTAKRAVELTSEGLECFGGQGYIEDTGIPAFLRDAQVLPIWEGTSSVMSLDMLRAIEKTNGDALKALKSRITHIVASTSSHSDLSIVGKNIRQKLDDLVSFAEEEPNKMGEAARDFATSLAQIYIATLLVGHASSLRNYTSHADQHSDIMAIKAWMHRDLAPAVTQNKGGAYGTSNEQTFDFVYDGYSKNELIAPTFVR